MKHAIEKNFFQNCIGRHLKRDFENSIWSVTLKRTSFNTASTGILGSLRKLGAGLLMLGVAATASAKDGLPNGSAPSPPSVKSKPGIQKPGIKSKRWFQVGVASWYGSKFEGRRTAGGDRYDMYGMTCAHRSLPLGTWLRVTNLKNHRTAFVRVNDRGPALQDRIVDLSYAAARVLGLSGVGKVRIEAVDSGNPALELAMVDQLQMPMTILQPVQ